MNTIIKIRLILNIVEKNVIKIVIIKIKRSDIAISEITIEIEIVIIITLERIANVDEVSLKSLDTIIIIFISRITSSL